MDHTLGDGIVALAAAFALVAYFYFKHREKQRRLEVIHAERLIAMEKGIPLPELPHDLPQLPDPRPTGQHVPLILGILLFAFSTGTMIALRTLSLPDARAYWVMPLPLALMGLGMLLYYFLAGRSK
jgi:hypothetical protein